MPELPEVETVRRGMVSFVVGRRIDRVEVGRERTVRRTSRQSLIDGLTGATITSIGRRGKYILCSLDTGDSIHVLGPLGNGFNLDLERPLLVGGGIGIAPLPYLSEALGRPPAVLGFRSDRHAEAAELVPNAQACVEPTLVTELIPAGMDVLACGPEPMLQAVRTLAPAAQLAWEAPMACGYGACYGCAVEIDGELKRLCVEGPVLRAA